MDLETVIGCFRDARLGRRTPVGLEGCERPAGDAREPRMRSLMRVPSGGGCRPRRPGGLVQGSLAAVFACLVTC